MIFASFFSADSRRSHFSDDVRTLIDPRLRDEAERFRLRFTCGDCVHFAEERRACANGYPTDSHLEIDLERAESLEFCKEFELV